MIPYIVVGAGFAGTVLAERIANKLGKKVLLIEKRNHIGGNCYDFRSKEGILIHRYGPHLFHTNFKEVWDYLSNFTDWHLYQHRVLAYVDGKNIPIPFNLNSLYQIFPGYLAKILEEKLIKNFSYGKKIPILELMKNKDKDIKLLANFIYEKIFVGYTQKQWGLKPEEIDPTVTARVPILISRDNRYFQDKYQGVPEEGYTVVFNKMLRNDNIKILLQTNALDLLKLDINTKKIYFLGKEFKGILIYTGPIDELFEYKYGPLPYRSLKLKFRTIDKEYYQETATINYPNDYDFTRITEFKHIHPIETSRTVILEEYPKSYTPNKDIPYYPFFTKEAMNIYSKYKNLAEEFSNLILVGRLAEYKYYDMDDIVKRALEVFEEKIK